VSCRRDQYRNVCRGEFARLHAKLDRVDDAVRGNGKVGILRRLDRLEQIEKNRRRLHWTIIGAAISAGVSALVQLIQLLIRGVA
jgi:hypothetical protein